MLFGLRNAPATFQRVLNIILNGVPWQSYLIYLDEAIVFSPAAAQHGKDVDEIFRLLQGAGVTLKLKKCAFFKNKVNCLGHTILSGKLEAAAEPTKAIMEAPFPTDKTRMRSFLGACNVYRRFVPGFSAVTRPLNETLKKDTEFTWEAPTAARVEAFEKLKNILANPPVLSLPRRGCPYMVETDTRQYALRAVLLQEQEVEGDVPG